MSLLNVFASPKRVLIGVNTESVSANHPAGPRGESDKVAVVARFGGALAGTGNATFMHFAHLCIVEFNVGFDQIVEQMLTVILPQAWRFTEDASSAGGWREHLLERQLIVLAGYSPANGATRAFAYHRHSSAEQFSADEISGSFCQPGDPFEGVAPDLDTPAKIERAARMQKRWGAAASPSCPLGGRLQILELTRGAVLLRDHCQL